MSKNVEILSKKGAFFARVDEALGTSTFPVLNGEGKELETSRNSSELCIVRYCIWYSWEVVVVPTHGQIRSSSGSKIKFKPRQFDFQGSHRISVNYIRTLTFADIDVKNYTYSYARRSKNV